jgi:hypothetical protein
MKKATLVSAALLLALASLACLSTAPKTPTPAALDSVYT